MITSTQAARVRVRRGARWLDENFPGWEGRINPETLMLHDGQNCICGQVFKGEAEKGDDGFGHAFDLFSEANAWITGIVKLAPVEPESSDPDVVEHRAQAVAVALGFDMGDIAGGTAQSDHVYVTFRALQDAWIELLKKRAET